MLNFFNKNKSLIVRFILLIPIILVAIISISHVTEWYNIANPLRWSIYLSIAIEIAAMVSIMAISLRIKGGVWAIFVIVTFLQMVGNIFYSYNQIDSTSELFKSWVELTSPIWSWFGSDSENIISMKRWLAFLEGGLLPIISLTSLHFFIKYNDRTKEEKNNIKEIIIEKEIPVEKIVEVEKPVEVIREVEKLVEVPISETENKEDDHSRKLIYTKNA